MTDLWGLTELRDHYRELIVDTTGQNRGRIRPARVKTNDPEQVGRLLQGAEAPEVLAMIAAYACAAGLSSGSDNWTMSCLPRWSGSPGMRRATTVSITRDEVFYVWMDLATGGVANWGARVGDLFPERAEERKGEWSVGPTKHGTFARGTGFMSFETFVGEAYVRDSILEVIEAARQSPAPRQLAWHNSTLAALVVLADGRPGDGAWNVPVGYVLRQYRQRLHARKARQQLLATRRNECQVCGLNRVSVLEAAHITPDSRDGKANNENLLLLCANHHRAMDAGMFVWSGSADDQDASATWSTSESPF